MLFEPTNVKNVGAKGLFFFKSNMRETNNNCDTILLYGGIIYLEVNNVLDHVFIPEETVIHLSQRKNTTVNQM